MQSPCDIRHGLPSASGIDRIMRCPGSWEAEKAFEQEESSHSRAGTDIHAVLEGKKPISELTESGKVTAERIMNLEGELVERYSLQAAEVHRERRLFRINGDFERLWSGQSDVIFVKKPLCVVINYKTGWYEPIAIDQNWQMIAECALAAEYFNCDYIVGVLLHPNAGKGKQTRVFNRQELSLLATAIDDAAVMAQQENAQRIPGIEQCHFCRANAACPAAQKQLIMHASEIDLSRMTPEQRGQRLRIFKMADAIIKSQREDLKDMLKKDKKSVFGWTLTKGKTERTLKAKDHEFGELVKAVKLLGLHEAEWLLPNLTKIEAAYRDKTKVSKSAAKTFIEKELDRWLFKDTGEPSLAEEKPVAESDASSQTESHPHSAELSGSLKSNSTQPSQTS